MSMYGAVKWTLVGWYLAKIFSDKGEPVNELPAWWTDTMLRAFAADQVAPKPDAIPQAVADAAGAAATAVQIPVGWLYALLTAGMDSSKLQIAAADIAIAARAVGAPADAKPETLSAWRDNVLAMVKPYVLPVAPAAAPEQAAKP